MEKSVLPYGPSRKRAGFTQEKAAEMLGISCRCLCDYETGVRPVPNPVVDLMVMAYDDRLLAVQHLRISTPAVNAILPEFRTGLPFGQTALRYYRLMHDFITQYDQATLLMLIAEDGKVDKQESSDYKKILLQMHEITASGLEVEYSEKGSQQ
jgi:transcriptional regulator with XRE-family HTH domain